jgi:murein DD-endopeptidase MepM/ murein hydrolase activator NlpD
VVPADTVAGEHRRMIRARRAHPPSDVLARVLAPLLILSLLLGAGLVQAAPAAAGSFVRDTADLRQRQRQTEATMLRADKQIRQLQRQRRKHDKLLQAAKRKLARAIERRDRSRERFERADSRLERAERIFARAMLVRPNPTGRQSTHKPRLRARLRQLERTRAKLQRGVRAADRAVDRARARKQARWTKIGRARVEARKAARERAEDRLASAISAALRATKARADRSIGLSSRRGFSKPVRGSITQRYGCTGYHINPRRGSCAHFHDGIDIGAGRGARVRASADGYVAYVGRNPWDAGSRAYVVIIGHSGGAHSVYAHLQPKRLVKTGQRVRRGDVIGRVGITGVSSGPHVHWEVWRDGRTVHPLRAKR